MYQKVKSQAAVPQGNPRLWRQGKARPPSECSGQDVPSQHCGIRRTREPSAFSPAPAARAGLCFQPRQRTARSRLTKAGIAILSRRPDAAPIHLRVPGARNAGSEGSWEARSGRPAPGRGDGRIQETRPVSAPRAPGRVPRPAGRRGPEGRAQLLFPRGLGRRRSACGAPGISTLVTHSGSNLRPEPQPCIPFPFLKLKTTSGIQHQALDHPQQPRPQDHESGNRIPTRALNPRPQTRSRIRDLALNPEPIPDLALNPGPPPRLPHLGSRRGPAPRMRP